MIQFIIRHQIINFKKFESMYYIVCNVDSMNTMRKLTPVSGLDYLLIFY